MIKTLAFLILAALLEAGGDALTRMGLNESRLWLPAGAAALAAYGVIVNQGSFDFGRLMGAYIAVFFVVSQLISLVLFRRPPGPMPLVGGALIILDGAIIMTADPN